MTPRRSGVSPLMLLVLQEQGAVRDELRRRRVPQQEQADLVQEALLVMVRRIVCGPMFVVYEDEREQRQKVRGYLRGIAERLARRWHARTMLVRMATEAASATMPAFTDPTARFEARSDVRGLDIPEPMVPLLVAIVELGNVSAAARAAGMRSPTAHTRMRHLRRDLRAAEQRRKGGRGRE